MLRARKTVKIKTSIWKDPEFTNLGWVAQWIYLSRRIYGQSQAFTPELACTWAVDVPLEVARTAADELSKTTYGYVLQKVVRRTKIPDRVRSEVYEADDWKCVVCGTHENLELDHIMPVSKGGSDERANLQTMCAYHNRRKGNRVDALV